MESAPNNLTTFLPSVFLPSPRVPEEGKKMEGKKMTRIDGLVRRSCVHGIRNVV